MSSIASINLLDIKPTISMRRGKACMTVYPRIHMFGLDLSLQSGILRSGSMGFSLTTMPVNISVQTANKDTIVSNYNGGDNNLSNLLHMLRKYLKKDTKWKVIITYPSTFRPHIGIGSSTQVAGGVLHCAAACAGIRLGCKDLFMMGMGNASMLGLSLVHAPGFIIEYGYKATHKTAGRILHPKLYSGYDAPAYSLLKIVDCPWYAVVGIPRKTESLSGHSEATFWARHLPDKDESARATAYSVFMDCIPGLIENDFQKFTSGLHSVLQHGTKPAEENLQNATTKRLLKRLRDSFGVASVSSLGPSIYAFSENDPSKLVRSLPFSDYEFIMFPLSFNHAGSATNE